jgi:hypothetical protein
MTRSEWVVGLAVMLCAADAALAQSLDRSMSAPADRLVMASARTRASLSLDGPWLPRAARSGDMFDVLRDEGPRIQIREEVDGVRLALYVDRGTLQTVTTDFVHLVATTASPPSDSDETPGMSLDPGTVVEVIARDDHGLSKVRVVERPGGEFRVTGFVPTIKLGFAFRHYTGPTFSDSGDVSLPSRFQLAATGGGSSFATYAGRRRVKAKQIMRTGAFTLVRVAASVTGWIASSQVKRDTAGADNLNPMVAHLVRTSCEESGEGVDGDGTGRCRTDPKNVVRETTPLLDGIDGRTVGAVSYFRAEPMWHDGGWARFDVKTSFGVAHVWAHLDDAAIASAKHAIEHANDPAPPGTYDSSFPVDVDEAPPPPPPPAPPQNIAPSLLERNRIRGDRNLPPDADVLAAMAKAGKDKLIGSFKVCIDDTGRVSSVTMLKATGFPSYDASLMALIRAWAFRPFEEHDKPTAVCSAFTFIHRTPAAD